MRDEARRWDAAGVGDAKRKQDVLRVKQPFRRCVIDHGISRPAGPLAYGQEGMQLCRYYTTLPKKGNVCPTMAAIPKG